MANDPMRGRLAAGIGGVVLLAAGGLFLATQSPDNQPGTPPSPPTQATMPASAADPVRSPEPGNGPAAPLGAHVHGEGRLDIAYEAGKFTMSLEAPAADIVGFEHPPANAEERAALDQSLTRLRAPFDLVRFETAGRCTVVKASAEFVLEPSDPPAAPGAAAASQHAEFHAAYEIVCANAPALTKLTFGYFDAFPSAQVLEIQFASRRGQSGGDVERANPTFSLAGLL